MAKRVTKNEAKFSLAEKLRKSKDPGIDKESHLMVVALAGTGKTTTLVGGVKEALGVDNALTPSPQQAEVWDAMRASKGRANSMCFTAFNKSIVAELTKRVPEGCTVKTNHGMGFGAVTRQFGKVNVDQKRVSMIVSELTNTQIQNLRANSMPLLRATEDLVDLCKQNLAEPTLESLDELASHYDVELDRYKTEVYDLVPKVLERCKDVEKDKCIDFTDMLWIPLALDLPVAKFDMLLVDEAQDLNRAQQQLALRAGRRIVMCGDPRQAIYGFAGADSESMPRMTSILQEHDRGCMELPLTVTYRCGHAIVAEARAIVPEFEAFHTNPPGKVSTAGFKPKGTGKSYHDIVEQGDMVLCRVNAPLVSECFRFLKAGRKANIQGRNIGAGLVKLINKLRAKDSLDLIDKLQAWYEKECKSENAKKSPSEQRLVNLQDKHDCLLAFCEGTGTVDEVLKRIDNVFTDNEGEGIRLSSVHKAKGLEADRVFFLMPEGASCPHPMAKSDWQRAQEFNILYVGITRAKNELVYVK